LRPGERNRTGLREHGRAGRVRNRAFLPDDHVGDCADLPGHCAYQAV